MKEVYIVSIARTPIGSINGKLAKLTAIDLGAHAGKSAIERAGIKAEHIQEVIYGHVLSANVGQAPARQVARAAGIPDSVPCSTVNKVCASGSKAIIFGTQAIQLGQRDIVLVGGMESMSNTPHYLPKQRAGIRYGHGKVVDGIAKDGLQDPFTLDMMGTCGDLCAKEEGFTREDQDAFAFQSYTRAREAFEKGAFKHEIAPVEIPQRKGDPVVVDRDEDVFDPRVTSLEGMGKLRPAFAKEGTVTAANAPSLNDGSAALVLMSKEKAEELGIKPLARIVSYGEAAQDPTRFTTAPALAMPIALEQAGLKVEDIDAFEINEAFSVVALANAKKLNIEHDKLNILGGSVAMGHPIGASGARIIVTMVSALQHVDGKYGLSGICNGGGGASSILIERL